MSTNTEQKILDAALKVFSEKGYNGARTRIIAETSGYTEMTLFRKFETKENLFNRVLTENKERIMKDFNSLLVIDELMNPKDQFRMLILNLAELVETNFEYVNIIVYERQRISNSITETFIVHLRNYVKKVLPKHQTDPNVISFMILSFLYFIILNKKTETGFFDLDQAIEEFIIYNSRCLGL